MRTRRQRAQDQHTKVQPKSTAKKPLKSEIVQKKQQQNFIKSAKGQQQLGAKKRKGSASKVPLVSKSPKPQTTGAKIKKGKQERIKASSISKSQPKQNKSQTKVTKNSATKNQKQISIDKKSAAKSPKAISTTKIVKSQSKDVIVKAKSPQKSRKVPQTKIQVKQNVKKIVMKGKIPVDDNFPLNKADYHVLEYQGKLYSATLNQTNVMNNNNKYYMLQILQSDTNPNNCYFFTRWGRVGVDGQKSNAGPIPIQSAIRQYNFKHSDKTRKGEYREIELNYGNQDDDKKQSKKLQRKSSKIEQKQSSKLSKQIQRLIQLIFDINMMNRQMVQIGYNVDKMPLGKLSRDNIRKGYGMLKQLDDQIRKLNRKDVVVRLTNDFYSYIPHDFGFTHMSLHILNTVEKVKSKLDMLEALEEIKVATTLLTQPKDDLNKLDSNYRKLNRNISHIDKDTTQFKTLNDYLHTTHGRHHGGYTLDITDLYKVESDMQNTRFKKDIHNKMLLWHGSRLTNFVGILSQGLRIAPPEAPVTGYMFGKGVYFADMSSKSANYCFTNRQNNTGILLLCEVALGNCNEKLGADYNAALLPEGKHSTKGVGRIQPNPKNFIEIEPGIQIPMGPGVQTTDNSIHLRYNQFIVYDIAQIKIRYLLRTKFNYH